jgi:hypothetical protein
MMRTEIRQRRADEENGKTGQSSKKREEIRR